MFRIVAHSVVILVSVLAFSTAASAATITTLYNTGVDDTGALVAVGPGTTDTHWDVISGPGISAPIDAVTYFNGAYIPDGPDSRWISNSATGSPGSGTFVFQTTFSLAGFNPAATTIGVTCATDNFLTSVSLNGSAVAGDCDSFGSFGIFNISSGFNGAVNTLQFNVQDTGQPMAFRAQFTSDATPINGAAIPEPASLLLVGSGVLGMVAKARRRKREQA